jgi:N-acetyl-beta-hexosaminidase
MITNSRTTKSHTKAELLAQLEVARIEIQRIPVLERELAELRATRSAPKPAAAKPLGNKLPAYFAAKSEVLFIRAYRTAHKCAVVPAEHIRAWRELQA